MDIVKIPVSQESLDRLKEAIEITETASKFDTLEYYGAVGRLIAWANYTREFTKVTKK